MKIAQGFLRTIKSCIYDTAFLPENLARQRAYLCVIPIGQYAGRRIKTWAHTNMVMCAQLPAPEKFFIERVKCCFVESDLHAELFKPADIPVQSKLWDGSLRLESMGLRGPEWRLRDLADSSCVRSVQDSMSQQETRQFVDYDGPVDLMIPDRMLLEQQQAFAFVLEKCSPNVPLDLLVVAEGIRAIPVPEENLSEGMRSKLPEIA